MEPLNTQSVNSNVPRGTIAICSTWNNFRKDEKLWL